METTKFQYTDGVADVSRISPGAAPVSSGQLA
jgi:hypothetical protein